jgi:hypothetical protein
MRGGRRRWRGRGRGCPPLFDHPRFLLPPSALPAFPPRPTSPTRSLAADPQARKQQAVLDAAPISDPAWNAALEAERQDEIRTIADACEVLGMALMEIQPDGHCMFASVADQLGLLGILPAVHVSRAWKGSENV